MKIFYIILSSLILAGCSSKDKKDTEQNTTNIKKVVTKNIDSIKKKLSEKKIPTKKEKVDFDKIKIQQIKIH